MIDFTQETYQNILKSMLDRVPDTYDKRDTSPIPTSVGPAAWALAVACLCTGMGSPDVVQAAPAAAQVDETMYVNLDYYGKIDQVSVVKGCSLNGNTSLTDYGNYRNVVNMSGNQQLIATTNFRGDHHAHAAHLLHEKTPAPPLGRKKEKSV